MPADGLRLGIAHHLGWAVAVTADADHRVVDRRRIELVEPVLPPAPIHHEGGPWAEHRSGPELSDEQLSALVGRVRASAARCAADALAELPAGITSISLQAWSPLPDDIAVLRQVPWESRADSVTYRSVLAEEAERRGWSVHLWTGDVEAQARAVLGPRADEVLLTPRRALGPPWTKDHRTALAATVLAG